MGHERPDDRWPTLAQHAAPLACGAKIGALVSLAWRSARFLEGHRDLSRSGCAHGSPLGARGRPPGAPADASLAWHGLRLPFRNRSMAPVTSGSVGADTHRGGQPYDVSTVDSRAALRKSQHRARYRLSRRRPDRRRHRRFVEHRRSPSDFSDVIDVAEGHDERRQGARARAQRAIRAGGKRSSGCWPPANARTARRCRNRHAALGGQARRHA